MVSWCNFLDARTAITVRNTDVVTMANTWPSASDVYMEACVRDEMPLQSGCNGAELKPEPHAPSSRTQRSNHTSEAR
eukprot:scaffold100641_cov31-Tisochrysis_lutea.AAC.5